VSPALNWVISGLSRVPVARFRVPYLQDYI